MRVCGDRRLAPRATVRGWKRCRQFGSTALASALALLEVSGSVHAEPNRGRTETPIKHLLVIIGENQSFDHVFATYRAPSGDHVSNLLSKGIIDINGRPGRNFAAGAQSSAVENGTYQLAPGNKQTYALLPPQTTGNLPLGGSDTAGPPFATAAGALAWETMFYHQYASLFHPEDMTVGANPFPKYVPDGRIANVNNLPNGPFQVTGLTPYDFYQTDMNHGFFAEWQEADCDISHATSDNPSGCLNDLFPWVEATRSANGIGGGGASLGFYNVANGDVPYFTSLAREYTMSDNYHQPMRGPSSPNWIFFGTADEVYFSDGRGNPATPDPSLVMNPDPRPGANNTPINDGATFVNCSDQTQPGVATIRSYIASLPYHPDPHCAPNSYYHVASRHPGYFPDGTIDTHPNALPPSSVPTIGERLSAKGISWSWYAGGYNRYVADPNHTASPGYCDNCNPFQFSTAVMSTAESRAAHLHDAEELITEIRSGKLPEVAFLRPEDAPAGHPDSSKLSSFENYVKVFIEEVQAQPKLWADTAIIVTFDEGGGFWDSGYVQPIDFFGDGVRVPMLVVSPYSRGGHVGHVYSDHASVVKFIERNWHLATLSARSRDNLPNPITGRNPYIPINAPAVGDLMELFRFDHDHDHDRKEFDQDHKH
ncbi:alkaline phosphatase family protein [Bradyrhizobium sp. WD16]|uniref:alkaline phosphatase family protein n=1 Tax=Bradyrhizobium sp. WD16 TaxID=1521768 RepID=UPI0020A464C0|nr:alkaline phosphatase family protein [Bradyrhizobium sp. WD16]UTD29761.1 phosphoesterase [Bradyrhizobium sp. WD16]